MIIYNNLKCDFLNRILFMKKKECKKAPKLNKLNFVIDLTNVEKKKVIIS